MRPPALLEATGAFLLVGLSLFWASTNYAADVGESRALQYQRQIDDLPRATLYSREPLSLDAPSVAEVVCTRPEGGYRFRYDGLRLMLRSGGHYFFLPEDWTYRRGVAMVVPETNAVRLDFSRSASQAGEAC